MSTFTFVAHVLGQEMRVTASGETGAYLVVSPASSTRVPDLRDAYRLARHTVGEYYLQKASHGAPWGLRVEVGGVGSAWYGDWPALGPGGGGAGSGAFGTLQEIRARYKDGGPMAALENALHILEACLGRR